MAIKTLIETAAAIRDELQPARAGWAATKETRLQVIPNK